MGCRSCSLFINVSGERSCLVVIHQSRFGSFPDFHHSPVGSRRGKRNRYLSGAIPSFLKLSVTSIVGILSHVTDIDQLAAMFGSSAKQLRFLLYARAENQRYTTFTISKRRGGERTILAPPEDLKAVQRALSEFLQDNTTPGASAHGFVRGRSIVSNAENHVSRRYVLNVDLKDFFPTINFGRVRGLFMSPPFCARQNIATILGQICCHRGALPQGAPTSPIVSNFICHKMDGQLVRLAQKYGCFCSRYADDLTFSRRQGPFPPEIAFRTEDDNVSVGEELRAIIQNNGFIIHPDKVNLYRNTQRQTVTGLTVNQKVNVSRIYIRQIRAMICDWRRNGQLEAEIRHHAKHYRRPDRLGGNPPIELIIQGKLNFLKMIRGADDIVRRGLQRQFVAEFPEYESVMEKENRELAMRDLFISHASEDKDAFVRPLVKALIKEGVSVWYDEHELTIGSDLAAEITKGLIHSRYGVVVMSSNFFKLKKKWPDREVRALTAQEDADGSSRILPIWHEVDQAFVASKNPILAGLIAWKSPKESPEALAKKFRRFLKSKSIR